MAGTGLAALPTAQVPEVGAAAVTALSLHVGQAVALPAALVALALLWPAGVGVGAQCVAGATWKQKEAEWGWGLGRRWVRMQTGIGWGGDQN